MRHFLAPFLILLGLLMAGKSVSASHFMGAELTYRQLSTTTYRIYLKQYFDCAGASTTPLPGPSPTPLVDFTSSTTNLQPIALGGWVQAHYREISATCPSIPTRCTSPTASIKGVSESLYYQDYSFASFPAGTSVTISWSGCCRNSALTSGAGDDGIYVAATIVVGLKNSAPAFSHPPVMYICAGMPVVLNQSAWDLDGDSLVYRLAPCLQSATQTVSYWGGAGFSALSPLGFTWLCSMNPPTGDLSLTPNLVGAIVNSTMAVRVEEYRNGQLLGTVMRDCQVVVIPCSGAAVSLPPAFSAVTNLAGGIETSPGHISAFAGDTLEFDLTLTDPDPGQTVVPVYGTDMLDGAVSLTSAGTNPTTVHVAVIAATDSGARHHLGIEAKDDFCTLPARKVNHVWITVDTLKILAFGITTPTPCDSAIGTIDLTAQGIFQPLSYLWSTGDTTEDLSGLHSGMYTVLITDQQGNSRVDTFVVESFDIIMTVTEGWASCGSDSSGMLSVLATGGIPPVAYHWNTGDTVTSIGGLPEGVYQVTALDSAGCYRRQTFRLEKPDSCVVKLRGAVFADWDLNCQRSLYDTGLPYTYVEIMPGGGTFTDLQGHWAFRTDTGAIALHAYAPASSPACGLDTLYKHPMAFGIDSVGNDFPRFMQAVSAPHDLGLKIHARAARPGFTLNAWVSVKNHSLATTAGVVHYQHDPQFVFVSAIPAGYTYDSLTHTITWLPDSFVMFSQVSYSAILQIPAQLPIGTAYLENAWVTALADTILWNNQQTINRFLVGSYDPNYKEVSPKGYWNEGFIPSSDSVLTYTIHFQNTGTDTAFFVTLRDTLDPDLDLKRYQHLGSSFPYTLRVEGDNVLVFRFDHINLPDSGRDEAGSHGFVSFTLPFAHPAQGVQVSNRVAIYFDFNAPIITNTVKNTICDPVEATFTATLLPDGGWQLMPEMHFANDWLWDFGLLGSSGDSIPAPLYLPDSGNYPIRLVASNWCSDEQALLLIQQAPNQIKGSHPVEMSILPNPAQDMARIRITAAVPTVTITDVAGRTLRTLPVTNGEATFVRGDLPAGMYYVRAVAADGRAAAMMMVLEP